MTDRVRIKNFLPRGLYGRAALILIVPVVAVQLVVSSVFLQRHFEDVTRQLTAALLLDLRLILGALDGDGDGDGNGNGNGEGRTRAEDLARALEVGLDARSVAPGTQRRFYDLSGVVVVEMLERGLPGLVGIDLVTEDREIALLVERDGARVTLSAARRRVSAAAPHQLLVIMVATSILMTVVAFVFLRNQLRPIRRLALAAEEFGKGRRTGYRPSGALEVRSAGKAFLDMRARIEGYLEQRTLMLSGVSHDLRTPLTRMRLSLGMMAEGPERGDLMRDVDEMEALVNTFLDFVRGDALDDPHPTDPVALAQDVVARAVPGGGEIGFEARAPAAPVPMRPLAVSRALGNLVGNAQRYGRGRIRVSVAQVAGGVRFRVEDDGPGIPAAQREEAQKPFIRLDRARNQNGGPGVGLGLAIARDIARRHGGSLQLGESADLGGLQVDLTLPR